MYVCGGKKVIVRTVAVVTIGWTYDGGVVAVDGTKEGGDIGRPDARAVRRLCHTTERVAEHGRNLATDLCSATPIRGEEVFSTSDCLSLQGFWENCTVL